MPSIASANAFAKLRLRMAGLPLQISQQTPRQTMHARRFVSFVMIVAAKMQRTVNDQALHLFHEGRTICACLSSRRLHRYDDVTERFTRAQTIAHFER